MTYGVIFPKTEWWYGPHSFLWRRNTKTGASLMSFLPNIFPGLGGKWCLICIGFNLPKSVSCKQREHQLYSVNFWSSSKCSWFKFFFFFTCVTFSDSTNPRVTQSCRSFWKKLHFDLCSLSLLIVIPSANKICRFCFTFFYQICHFIYLTINLKSSRGCRCFKLGNDYM